MIITDSKSIKEIQNEFREKFPFLKIEFYATPHQLGEASPAEKLLSKELHIGEIRSIHKTGDLSIDGRHTVDELEENFRRMFGLNVQVFRQSGNIWIQTTRSDDWSLETQNIHGRESAPFLHN